METVLHAMLAIVGKPLILGRLLRMLTAIGMAAAIAAPAVIGVGITLGYSINDNLNLTAGYKSTINDSGSDDLRMDCYMVSLVFGWHPLLEGSKRLKEEKSPTLGRSLAGARSGLETVTANKCCHNA